MQHSTKPIITKQVSASLSVSLSHPINIRFWSFFPWFPGSPHRRSMSSRLVLRCSIVQMSGTRECVQWAASWLLTAHTPWYHSWCGWSPPPFPPRGGNGGGDQPHHEWYQGVCAVSSQLAAHCTHSLVPLICTMLHLNTSLELMDLLWGDPGNQGKKDQNLIFMGWERETDKEALTCFVIIGFVECCMNLWCDNSLVHYNYSDNWFSPTGRVCISARCELFHGSAATDQCTGHLCSSWAP